MYICLHNQTNHDKENIENMGTADQVAVSFSNMDKLVLRDLFTFYGLASIIWSLEQVVKKFKRRQTRKKRRKHRVDRG